MVSFYQVFWTPAEFFFCSENSPFFFPGPTLPPVALKLLSRLRNGLRGFNTESPFAPASNLTRLILSKCPLSYFSVSPLSGPGLASSFNFPALCSCLARRRTAGLVVTFSWLFFRKDYVSGPSHAGRMRSFSRAVRCMSLQSFYGGLLCPSTLDPFRVFPD